MRPIILDCDDILLNWLGGFGDYISRLTGKELCERGPQSWCMSDWVGLPADELPGHIQTFNASPHFGKLEPVDGAFDAIHQLKNLGDLHVLTSCSSDPVVSGRRHRNLIDVFGDLFHSVVCLDLGQSKLEALKAFKRGVWVEDNYKNAVLGVEAGHRTFLRRTSHNAREAFGADPEITWFDHWDEIVPKIKEAL